MNYLNEDTIAALSSGAGHAAIAVIRLSGKQSFKIINDIFKPVSKNRNSFPSLLYGYLFDKDKKIDEVICAFFKAPATYTGEDIVEISAHGNPIIVDTILNLLYKNGARAAAPGEFTYRAFLNGKKDLAEAEAVCDLISAKTAIAVQAALNNISGEFSRKIEKIKDTLTTFLAYLEASLDYPSDDIPFMTQKQKFETINTVIEENSNLLETYKRAQKLKNGMKAAIIGKPNAGKSSLLNAILGKNRAIVTEIAGTTTDTIEEIIDCHGIPLTLIDTAGIRNHAENSIEILGQERSKSAANKADILLWVFDASRPLDKNDLQIAEYIKNSAFTGKITAVLNKSDLPSKINKNEVEKLADFVSIVNISAQSPKSVIPLIDKISEIAAISDKQNEYLMINSRHFELLQKAYISLVKVKEIIETQKEDEIACFELKNALSIFEEILGINTPHDILDTIFGTFCIGK